MPGLSDGAQDFAALSRRLKDAGENSLRRALYKKIREEADPITREIKDVAHLRPYLPDRYAETLAADMKVTTVQRGSLRSPGIRIEALGREKKRRVALLEKGLINHPKWPRGPRETWNWRNGQTGGMRPGFFSDVVRDHGSDFRKAVEQAMADTAAKITKG